MNVDEILSGGAPTAKFPTVGTVIKGTIVSVEKSQQTDMDTGTPKTWDNGDPMWQWVFTLQTDQRDADIADDDGQRRVFAKGQMKAAVDDAIRKSGQKSGTIVGGKLAVKYASDGEPKKRGWNPPKIYSAQYQPPAPADDDFFAAPAPAAKPAPASFGDEEPF